MPHRPEVVVFDVNETLTDLSPLRDRLESVGAPRHLLDSWFAATLRDGFALTSVGEYADFAAVAKSALRTALAGSGAGFADEAKREEAVAEVISGFPALDVHPDVPAGLRRLREAGVRLVTLTNGAAEMTRGSFERAGVLDLFERRLSVSEPRRWKPAPEPYLWAVGECGVPADRAALVAVHPWDTDGAARAGLTTAWIDRSGRPFPDIFRAPDVTGPDLPAVVESLLALAAD
ncbi:haloacid dehalogenase type II [Actinopolymorpha singaporensis]